MKRELRTEVYSATTTSLATAYANLTTRKYLICLKKQKNGKHHNNTLKTVPMLSLQIEGAEAQTSKRCPLPSDFTASEVLLNGAVCLWLQRRKIHASWLPLLSLNIMIFPHFSSQSTACEVTGNARVQNGWLQPPSFSVWLQPQFISVTTDWM